MRGASVLVVVAAVVAGCRGPSRAPAPIENTASVEPPPAPADPAAHAHFEAGLRLHHDGRYQEALAAFERFLELAPPDDPDRPRAEQEIHDIWATIGPM